MSLSSYRGRERKLKLIPTEVRDDKTQQNAITISVCEGMQQPQMGS